MVNAGFSFMASERLTLFGDAYYVSSEEDFDRPHLGTIKTTNPWSLFDVSDYSDLRSDELRVSAGLSFSLMEDLTFQLKATYVDFDEDEYYMQDNDGSAFYTFAGLKWKF